MAYRDIYKIGAWLMKYLFSTIAVVVALILSGCGASYRYESLADSPQQVKRVFAKSENGVEFGEHINMITVNDELIDTWFVKVESNNIICMDQYTCEIIKIDVNMITVLKRQVADRGATGALFTLLGLLGLLIWIFYEVGLFQNKKW
jgi:hypothetical protein